MDKLAIKDITVYTKQNCVYCVKAKALLKGLGLTFTEKSLETDFNNFTGIPIYKKVKRATN